jgi:hypothetical protein
MNRSTTLERSPENSAISAGISAGTSARRPLRRRFTLVAVGLLSVLMAVLGVNFAADSATSEATIVDKAGIEVTTGTPQGWSVSVGSAGTVPAPTATQKIATINPVNTTSSKVLVSVYITNLSELAVNYSSWNFNLGLWDSSTPSVRVGTAQVMTSDSGTISWVVAVDTTKTYTLKLEAGGSFYTISTNTTTGSLSPKFFVRATQL